MQKPEDPFEKLKSFISSIDSQSTLVIVAVSWSSLLVKGKNWTLNNTEALHPADKAVVYWGKQPTRRIPHSPLSKCYFALKGPRSCFLILSPIYYKSWILQWQPFSKAYYGVLNFSIHFSTLPDSLSCSFHYCMTANLQRLALDGQSITMNIMSALVCVCQSVITIVLQCNWMRGLIWNHCDLLGAGLGLVRIALHLPVMLSENKRWRQTISILFNIYIFLSLDLGVEAGECLATGWG